MTRLTRRGHLLVETCAQLALLLALGLVLLAGFLLGEHSRCDRLTDPNARAYYSCGGHP